MPTPTLYAHTLAGHGESAWEPLPTHLGEVAAMAEGYTSAFTRAGWGHVLGGCHDLGKASAPFQAKLHAANPHEAEDAGESDGAAASQRVDHSTFGARYVHLHAAPIVGELLAYCIAGHHAGLPNGKATDDASANSTLEQRLNPACISIPHVADPGLALPPLDLPFRPAQADIPFALAFSNQELFQREPTALTQQLFRRERWPLRH